MSRINQKLYVVLGKHWMGTWKMLHPPTDSRHAAEVVFTAWAQTPNLIYDELLILGGRPRRWERSPKANR